MTRKDELNLRAKSLNVQIEGSPGCSENILKALLQVEREVPNRVVKKIETEMDKENESTDDQIWEIRNWCRQEAQRVKEAK